MKIKFIFFLLFSLIFRNIQAQTIQKIEVKMDGEVLTSIEIYTEEYVFVLNENGWVGSFSTRNLNGNLDYFDNEHFEKEKYGKLKSFGDIKVEYWQVSNERDARYGKIKRIGNINLDYFDSEYYESEKFGKVKSIGIIPIDYWKKDGFDTASAGKLKSIGNIALDYWENEPLSRAQYGKIKNFGPVKFQYWEHPVSDKERFGKLKSISGNSEKILVKVMMNDRGGIYKSVPY